MKSVALQFMGTEKLPVTWKLLISEILDIASAVAEKRRRIRICSRPTFPYLESILRILTFNSSNETMKSKKFRGGQGIRKRKKASKQTLAVNAERKEKRYAKIEKRIAEAEERERQREARALGIDEKFRRDEDVEENDLMLLEEEEEATDERAQLLSRKLEGQQTAYGRLVNSLQKPVFDHQNVRSLPAPKPVVNGANGTAYATDASKIAEETKNDKDAKADVTSSKETLFSEEDFQREHDAAYHREKIQFDTEVKPVQLDGKLSSIGFHEQLGKVSVSLKEEDKVRLMNALAERFCDMGASSIGMRQNVFVKWRTMLQDKYGISPKQEYLSDLHKAFIFNLREFRDVLMCSQLSIRGEQIMRNLYVAHCLSHVLRCRSRVLQHDEALKSEDGDFPEAKDQGFSRARVLILVPMRNVAYDVVKALMALAVGVDGKSKELVQVTNSERFEQEFAPGPDVEEEDDEMKDENGSSIAGDLSLRTAAKKPRDHKFRFRGNVDDDFKLGIAFAKKNMRLYTEFYVSDVIVASPLGLRRAMAEKASGESIRPKKKRSKGDDDDEWKTGLSADRQKRTFDDDADDFLSSIEVCIIDGADVFSMQNWNTVLETMGMMNKMPEGTRHTDFSRVREWCLDGLMVQFRQTVVLSSYRKSEFVSLFRDMKNHAGKVQLIDAPRDHGSMGGVVVSMRQTFFKVPLVDSPESSPTRDSSFSLIKHFHVFGH